MPENKFTRDQVKDKSLFSKYEKKIADKYAPKIPKVLETNRLTYLSFVWTLFILIFGYLAKENIQWLWGVSAMIVLHYITDMFDGAVGRYRETGLIRWGYFMDHMFDFIYLNSILIVYAFIFSHDSHILLMAIMAVFSAFFINSHLSFSATEEFKITYLRIGPTEIQLGFVITNILIIIFGTQKIEFIIPYVLIAAIVAFIALLLKTQKNIWDIDMRNKRKLK
jgi:phosphatidylglycerophosphate synthase